VWDEQVTHLGRGVGGIWEKGCSPSDDEDDSDSDDDG
jgi:hypothetical protein